MESNSKVSIVIPVYNGENYIKESIESALNQDYSDCEVIVVNDGSKDKTDEICRSFEDKIKYIKKDNGGVSSALNVALKNMTGKYFSWLSHDDLYDINKISEQMKIIKGRENIILFGDYRLINKKGEHLEDQRIKKTENSNSYDPILYGQINGITLLIPKKIFDKVGNFDEKLRCVQDYDMWFRILKKGFKLIHVPNILTSTRIHEMQDTNKNPAVYIEGNKLWVEIINYYSKLDNNNSFEYYSEAAKRMYRMEYNQAFNYCIDNCKNIDEEKTKVLHKELNKIRKEMNPSVFTRTTRYLKKKGIRKTIKRILNK